MAWTETTRPRYDRRCLRYASDCTDEAWAVVEPLLASGPTSTELSTNMATRSTSTIAGEARIVERACGLGASALAEAVQFVDAHLKLEAA